MASKKRKRPPRRPPIVIPPPPHTAEELRVVLAEFADVSADVETLLSQLHRAGWSPEQWDAIVDAAAGLDLAASRPIG